MKRFMIVLCVAAAVVGLAVSSVANAAIKLNAEFPTIVKGGLSYDKSGHNVVVAGSAFWDAIEVDNYLGQGESQGVDGNFAFYAVCTYNDSQGALAFAMANPNTPLDLEIRIHGMGFDTSSPRDGVVEFRDNFTFNIDNNVGGDPLNDVGFPVTFAQLAAVGYVDLAPYYQAYYGGPLFEHVWADIALGDTAGVPIGQVALSVVFKNYSYSGDAIPLRNGDVEANVVAGNLWTNWTTNEYGSGSYNQSGARVATPEPASMAVWGLLGLIVAGCGLWRRRRTA
jgi:hypothetical protein